jgi:hypothetical protein
MARWRERGLMRTDRAALTKAGLLLLDRFVVEAFEDIQNTFFVKNLSE